MIEERRGPKGKLKGPKERSPFEGLEAGIGAHEDQVEKS